MKKHPRDFESSEADALRALGVDAAQPSHSACPAVDQLRAAQAGALPEDALDAIAEHMRQCAVCRQLQADFEAHEYPELSPAETDRLYARIRAEASGEQAKAARAGRRFFFRPAVVMGALAILAVVVLLQMDRFPRRVEAPVPPSAQSASRAQPAPPAFALPLVKPEVKFTAAALVFRGSGGGQSDFMKDIAPALDAYRADRFAEAAGLFLPLAKKYPQSVEVWFYLGVSRLMNNDAAVAEQAFGAAAELQEKSFADDVEWYLSVARERAGRPAEAVPLLKKLCADKGAHQTEACAGVERLESRAPGESGPPRR